MHAVADRVVITGQDINPGIGSRIDAIQKIYPTVLNFTTADPVGMRPMVQMDVKIMEFDTNALEELGIQWDNVIRGPVAGIVKDFTNNNYYRINPEQSPANGVLLPNKLQGTQAFFGIATQIGSAINLMMNKGKAFLLASPQLSARSGGQAKFLAGGEVPIPVPQGFGQVTVDYKEYGIKLDIEPLVNFNQDISTRILAEVSRVDPTVTVQGVPGFTTRRTESEINVHAGETIVISGLIDSSAQQDAKRLPLLGDIPILGKLFRSDGFRGNRTELVMFVTPRVVTPGSQETSMAWSVRDRSRSAASRPCRAGTKISCSDRSRRMFNILIDTPNRDQRRVRCLHRECGIGRGDGNLVVLQGWSIAQRHAALKREDEGIFIESLGGRSPVLVNGEQVRQPWPAHQP
jgi:pilus assembly protein CpaC